MNEKSMRKASLSEIRKMKEQGQLLPTKSVEEPCDFDIPADFWDTAEIVNRSSKKTISIRVDEDILQFFKQKGKGHLTRMHDVLRSYVNAHSKKA